MSDLVRRVPAEEPVFSPQPDDIDEITVPGVLKGELLNSDNSPVFEPPFWQRPSFDVMLGAIKRAAFVNGLIVTYALPRMADTEREAVSGTLTGVGILALSGILHLIQERRNR